MAAKTFILASGNAHKARELERAVPEWKIELLAPGSFPDETGATFYENARAKAEYGRSVGPPDAWVLGEDSGLEVDALGGRPGIYSARYAGADASDEANVEALLAELANVPENERRARYVCELVALSPGGAELRATGTLAGRIARRPSGSEGFGYDPVFVPVGETSTVAELGDAWKSARSHRAQAARALRRTLRRSGEAL